MHQERVEAGDGKIPQGAHAPSTFLTSDWLGTVSANGTIAFNAPNSQIWTLIFHWYSGDYADIPLPSGHEGISRHHKDKISRATASLPPSALAAFAQLPRSSYPHLSYSVSQLRSSRASILQTFPSRTICSSKAPPPPPPKTNDNLFRARWGDVRNPEAAPRSPRRLE